MPLLRANLKFRHLYGEPGKKEELFENVPISRNAHDGQFLAVNSEFLAVACESSGGGAFLIWSIHKPGRLSSINLPKIGGHVSPVIELAWNPFDDYLLASGSEDGIVKVWRVSSTSEVSCQLDLEHSRRLQYLEWHPSAADIILTANYDNEATVWARDVRANIVPHPAQINSVAWSPDGRLFATTCKDKNLRVLDPRSGCVVAKVLAHNSNKVSKCVFSEDHQLVTTGFNKYSERQIAVWDINQLREPLQKDDIDSSSGVLLPYYDRDCNLLYLAGKGDGNIRFYEFSEGKVHYLNQFSSRNPQKCIAQLPKRDLERSRCEVARLYRLHPSTGLIEPIRVIAPRRGHYVQEIYPPTAAPIPALSSDQWLSGMNRSPVRVDLSSGELINPPAPLPPAEIQIKAPVKLPKPVSSISNIRHLVQSKPEEVPVPVQRQQSFGSNHVNSQPKPEPKPTLAEAEEDDLLDYSEEPVGDSEPANTCGPEKFSKLLNRFEAQFSHHPDPELARPQTGIVRRVQSFRVNRPVAKLPKEESKFAANDAKIISQLRHKEFVTSNVMARFNSTPEPEPRRISQLNFQPSHPQSDAPAFTIEQMALKMTEKDEELLKLRCEMKTEKETLADLRRQLRERDAMLKKVRDKLEAESRSSQLLERQDSSELASLRQQLEARDTEIAELKSDLLAQLAAAKTQRKQLQEKSLEVERLQDKLSELEDEQGAHDASLRRQLDERDEELHSVRLELEAERELSESVRDEISDCKESLLNVQLELTEERKTVIFLRKQLAEKTEKVTYLTALSRKQESSA